LCVFLQVQLITVERLDHFFFDSLNRHPFNYRLLIFAIRFLHDTLVESRPTTFQPSDMILSLSLIVETPVGVVEQQ
jgi:hypothetical protein